MRWLSKKRERRDFLGIKYKVKTIPLFPISNPSSLSSLLLCSLRLFFINSLLYFSVTSFSLLLSPLSPSPLSVFHLQTNRSILLMVRSSDGGQTDQGWDFLAKFCGKKTGKTVHSSTVQLDRGSNSSLQKREFSFFMFKKNNRFLINPVLTYGPVRF